ncbi:MAG: NAD(P)-binding domain-containing protein [Clostridiales bacterium]|nr:NAD(P)-binding domain-containing protein [Clostridiales bacterium]
MRVAVLGAGNGGMAMAAHMVIKGHDVSIYDKYPETLEGIQKAGGIYLKGAVGEEFAPINLVSSNVAEVVRNRELIMIVTPAFAHRGLAEILAPVIEASQIIILHPGRTGGALEVKRTIEKNRPGFVPVVAEAQTLLYASRKTGEAEVTIYGIKNRVAIAAIPAKHNELMIDKLNGIFEEFYPAENIWETSLMNIGAVFHPAPSILNCARIEDTKGDFEYYHQGISPSLGKVLERIDRERVEVAKALGVNTMTVVEWLKDVYGAEGQNIYEAVHSNKVYGGIKAPMDINARYISEDVPMSLVPISELGRLTGVKTPIIDAMITLADVLHGKDYRAEGRNLESMGIKGMEIKELISMVR